MNYVDGKVTASFTRSVSTVAADDIDISQCQHLAIALGDGFAGSTFNKHLSTPPVSEEKYCFVTESDSSAVTFRVDIVSVLAMCLAVLLLK